MIKLTCLFLAALILWPSHATLAQSSLTADDQKAINEAATQTLASTGVPSASVAVVKKGQIVYAKAYGQARLETATAARSDMRYSIGSITKQITAAAILMLAEKGKLSLNDPVAKFMPDLTRAKEVTIRQLLSHTAGYQDYWPQDYVPPFMLKPVVANEILDRWARIPLDFDPGTQWQYSNTGYVIAGLIVEKAGGLPLMEFFQRNIFAPLQMESVLNIDQDRLTESDPAGYMHYALGPPRLAPKEGKGWLYAAGELAMTAADLARWDISLMNQTLLKPASYREMETEVRLKNGQGARYGLGMSVARENNKLVLSHGGEVSGFAAQNVVLPEDRAAVVVLTNMDASSAASQIVRKIRRLLFPALPVAEKKTVDALQRTRQIFAGLQRGEMDRSLFTANCNSYFNRQALRDFADSLGPLGVPDEFRLTGQNERGGMGFRAYTLKFKDKSVAITVRDLPDGKIEQFQVMAVE